MSIIEKNNQRQNTSSYVPSQKNIDSFISNPANTFLVSFPRTGSHWLRMMMELYFERPTLVRAFYYFDKTDYLTYHTHDLDLDLVRQDVIYLYRDPIPTIFSQLMYHKENIDDTERIIHWTSIYGKHLDKWLVNEKFTTHKTLINYEALKANLIQEFSKITKHFGSALHSVKLEEVSQKISKVEVKNKTKHDSQVMNLDDGYTFTRKRFADTYNDLIWETIYKKRRHLKQFFQ